MVEEVASIDESQYDCILRPEADLAASGIPTAQQQFKEALATVADSQVLLDLTGCKKVDSQGMGLVVGIYKECQQRNSVLRVAISSAFILKLFKMMQLDKHIDVVKVTG